MKIRCLDCGVEKGPEFFHADKSRPTGCHPYCKACRIIREEARRRAKGIQPHPERTEEEVRARQRDGRLRRYRADPERFREKSAKARRKNPDYGIAYMNQWRQENPEAARTLALRASRKRKAAIKQATPRWASPKSLRDFYEATPEGMEVDHIVPIQGFTFEGYPVSGLHCVANFQYMEPGPNRRKGNTMTAADAAMTESGE